MNRRRFALWAAVILILAPLAGAQSYAITDLGLLPGGIFSGSSGINDQGNIAGACYFLYNIPTAFLWTASGGMQNLGTLDSGYFSYAQGLNDSNVVVGGSVSYANFRQAFIWTQKSGMRSLGSLGGQSQANSVTDSGEVVGYSYLADNITIHPFLWTKATGMQDLGTLGGTVANAVSINEAGEIAGYSMLANGDYHAFLWTQEEGMQDLGTLAGGNYSAAVAVNAAGEVVGNASIGIGKSQAFVWTQSRGMQTLDVGLESGANAVNNVGDIVGSDDSNESAFLWTPAERYQNLNGLIPPNSGWVLAYASGINKSGQITATGTINGESHAALLTPTN